jgi:biopolymer transport protein ExbD
MAIRSSSKISASFNMSSMTDLVFLLLIFFMITSTLVSPNALKLLLPESNSRTSAKAITTVAIKPVGGSYQFYVEKHQVPFQDVEAQLISRLKDAKEPVVSLHVDKSVPMEQVVKVMNIAARQKWKMVLATAHES